MENEALIARLKEQWPETEPVQGADWPELNIEAPQLMEVIRILKDSADLAFDYLFCETCVDWKTHFTMVYHLRSTQHQHSMVLKAKTNRDNPVIDSLAFVYRTAEQHEREIFDLFGIQFTGHPCLKRILLTEDWVGHPLRKDYEDPINMIKL